MATERHAPDCPWRGPCGAGVCAVPCSDVPGTTPTTTARRSSSSSTEERGRRERPAPRNRRRPRRTFIFARSTTSGRNRSRADRNLFRFKPKPPPPRRRRRRRSSSATSRAPPPAAAAAADSAQVHRNRRGARAVEADRGARRFDRTFVSGPRGRRRGGAVSHLEDRRGINGDGVSGRPRPANDSAHWIMTANCRAEGRGLI